MNARADDLPVRFACLSGEVMLVVIAQGHVWRFGLLGKTQPRIWECLARSSSVKIGGRHEREPSVMGIDLIVGRPRVSRKRRHSRRVGRVSLAWLSRRAERSMGRWATNNGANRPSSTAHNFRTIRAYESQATFCLVRYALWYEGQLSDE